MSKKTKPQYILTGEINGVPSGTPGIKSGDFIVFESHGKSVKFSLKYIHTEPRIKLMEQ
jgi:hypothetical protein